MSQDTNTYRVPPKLPVPWPLQYTAAGVWVGAGGDIAALRRLRPLYGDMFSVPVPRLASKWFAPEYPPFRHLVLVGAPDLVKQVFAADAETLHFGDPNPLGRVIGANSLFSLDGARHLARRRIVLPPFHGERMRTYESIVEEETLNEIASWPQGREIRTASSFMRITLNVILRAVFGVREGPLMDELRVQVPRAVRLGQALMPFGPLRRDLGPRTPQRAFKQWLDRFQWGVNALVDAARRDPELERRTDVLALFAQARHEDDDSLLGDEEIADQLKDIVAAGHETTANTLAWAIERLSRHPEVVRRLAQEAEGEGKAFREATIREVQRTRPVIPGTGRYTVKPFELGGYLLPPYTVILLVAPLLHHDPEVYPNPDAFDPDRFVGKRPNPHSWIPFGGGLRRCPGAAFAHMEMDIVLRTLMREVELQPTRRRDERWLFRESRSRPQAAVAPHSVGGAGPLIRSRSRRPRNSPRRRDADLRPAARSAGSERDPGIAGRAVARRIEPRDPGPTGAPLARTGHPSAARALRRHVHRQPPGPRPGRGGRRPGSDQAGVRGRRGHTSLRRGLALGSTLGPHSLLAIDGAEHTEHRKLLMPPFHGERMQAYESIVEEEAIREIESWPDGREIRTLEPFMRITLNAIIRAVFGADGDRYRTLAEEMRQVMPKMIAIGARIGAVPFLQRDLGPPSPWGQFLRQRKRFEWAINTLIDDARRDPELERRDDVLALLAQARHESDGSPMSDEEIHDELATMLAAGHETTATTLAWGIERLRRHPELVARLAREADDGSRELRVATIQELQRVRPVVPGTGRLVVKPFRLGDYVIPPGHGILISATLTHEDPRLFPNPRSFDPDRFVGKRPDPFAWVPFGGGRRRCPGAAFAHMEMDVVLRTILNRLEIEPTEEADEAWAFRGVTFAPGKGGRAVFRRRARRSGERASVSLRAA